MTIKRLQAQWFRITVHIGALIPLAVLIWSYSHGQLTADPIRAIILRTGKTALILLVLSLACTPVNSLFGFKPALKVRRALGLYAFLYAAIHLSVFVGLDYGFDPALLQDALLEKRYALVGFAAFLILLPLAITSTRGWMRRLGQTWKKLHQWVYPGGPVRHHSLRMAGQGRHPRATDVWRGRGRIARVSHPARPAMGQPNSQSAAQLVHHQERQAPASIAGALFVRRIYPR
jgi:sulfoxide reductase heme-binding subunit YedZ